MTTGRINQIAIPTDLSASEKRSSQPRPTDADPEPKLRTRTPVEALLINSRVCLRQLYVSRAVERLGRPRLVGLLRRTAAPEALACPRDNLRNQL